MNRRADGRSPVSRRGRRHGSGLAAAVLGLVFWAAPAAAQAAPTGAEPSAALYRAAVWASREAGLSPPPTAFVPQQQRRLATEWAATDAKTRRDLLDLPRTWPAFLRVYAGAPSVFRTGLIRSIRQIYQANGPTLGYHSVAENIAGLAEEWAHTGGPQAQLARNNQMARAMGLFGGPGTGGAMIPRAMDPGCRPLANDDQRNSTAYCRGFNNVPNITGGVQGR